MFKYLEKNINGEEFMKKVFINILMTLLTILIVITIGFRVIRKDFNYVDLVPYFITEFNNDYLKYIKDNYKDEYNYYSSYINKYLNGNNKFDIDRDKLLVDVYNVVDDLNEKYDLKIDKSVVETEMDKILLKIKDIRVYQENSDYLGLIKLIFNNYFYYFVILLTFITLLLLIILSKVKDLLKNIGIPLIISGSILLAIGLVLKNIYFNMALLNLFNSSFIDGLIIFSVGIVMLFVNQLILELRKDNAINSSI